MHSKAILIWWQKIRFPDLANADVKSATLVTIWAIYGLLLPFRGSGKAGWGGLGDLLKFEAGVRNAYGAYVGQVSK